MNHSAGADLVLDDLGFAAGGAWAVLSFLCSIAECSAHIAEQKWASLWPARALRNLVVCQPYGWQLTNKQSEHHQHNVEPSHPSQQMKYLIIHCFLTPISWWGLRWTLWQRFLERSSVLIDRSLACYIRTAFKWSTIVCRNAASHGPGRRYESMLQQYRELEDANS